MDGLTIGGLRQEMYSESQATSRRKAAAMLPKNTAGTIGKLLVTGGTGFIGGAVLAELYDSAVWSKTLIMVRAADLAQARQRIEDSIARFLPGTPISNLRDGQIVLSGLEDAGRLADDRRIRDVTHVIHSAAVTSFANHPRIQAVNVDASLAFVATLERCAKVQRFLNVGTAWCVGMDVDKLVAEDGEQGSAEHVVPYTQSKLEFERRVRRQHPNFPLISARPSIVVGHTRLGTAPSGSIYWVFRAAQVMGEFTCGYDERVDVVPVDWVANALVHLTAKKELWYDTYHLAAGETSFSTIGELDAAIARGRNTKANGRNGFHRVSTRAIATSVRGKLDQLGDANPTLLTRALTIYSRFAESGVLFENRRTLAEGIAPPPPFHSYAAECARTAETTSIAAQMEDDFK